MLAVACKCSAYCCLRRVRLWWVMVWWALRRCRSWARRLFSPCRPTSSVCHPTQRRCSSRPSSPLPWISRVRLFTTASKGPAVEWAPVHVHLTGNAYVKLEVTALLLTCMQLRRLLPSALFTSLARMMISSATDRLQGSVCLSMGGGQGGGALGRRACQTARLQCPPPQSLTTLA